MAPPNVRDLVADIRASLERFPKEALVEILTYVFKEYVVEGPAPIEGTLAQLPTGGDLEGLSFAELVRTLQLRFDLPELALFEVTEDRVMVRIGGQRIPLETAASRSDPLPAPPPMAAPNPPVAPMPPAAAAPVALPPRPAVATESARPPPAQPTRPTPVAKPEAAPSEAESGDRTGRFGLLEID